MKNCSISLKKCFKSVYYLNVESIDFECKEITEKTCRIAIDQRFLRIISLKMRN